VADDLVDDVRLGCVERLGAVPEVLRGVERARAEVGVELAQRHQPRGGAIAPPGEWPESGADVVQLGHVVGRQTQTVLGRKELAVRVLLVFGCQLLLAQPPDPVLVLGVVDDGHRARRRVDRRRGDVGAPCPVGRVVQTRVAVGQMHLDGAVLPRGDG